MTLFGFLELIQKLKHAWNGAFNKDLTIANKQLIIYYVHAQ